MNTLLTSKTAWTFVVLFIISGTNGVMGLIPAQFIIYIQMFLTVLGAYFHVDTVNTLKGRITGLGGFIS